MRDTVCLLSSACLPVQWSYPTVCGARVGVVAGGVRRGASLR